MKLLKSGNRESEIYSVLLEFKDNFSFEQAFMALFQCIEPERLSGIYFYGMKEPGRMTLRVAKPGALFLDEIAMVMRATPDFTDKLKVKDIEVKRESPQSQEIPLGMMTAGKLRGGRKVVEAAESGLSLARSNPMYVRLQEFDANPCPACGEDAKWQPFCPNCKAQCMKVSNGAKFFLIVVWVLNIISLVTLAVDFNYIAGLDIGNKTLLYTTLVIDMLRCLGYLISTIAIFKFRIKGFWVYMGLRIFDILLVLFNLMAYGSATAVASLFTAIAWLVLSYIFLKRDVDYMV